MSRRTFEVDWAGSYGTLSGTLHAAGAALALVFLAQTVRLPAWYAVGFAVVGMAVMHVRSVQAGLTTATQWYRFLCWVGVAGWTWWAMQRDIFFADLPEVVAGLGILAMAAGMAAPGFARIERTEQEETRQVLIAADRDELGAWWDRQLSKKSGTKGCKVERLDYWPGDPSPGYTLDVDISQTGRTWGDFVTFAPKLAAAVPLPTGCGVEIGEGFDQGHMLVKVSTVDTSAEHRYMPADFMARSIVDPVFLGWARDDAEALADMRQSGWLSVARPGAGKTTLQNVLIHGVGQCVDALPWVADFNAGALGVPWVLPWWEGRVPDGGGPVVDWIAWDAEEMTLQVRAAFAIAMDRKRPARAGQLKRAKNTTLMPVSTDLPAIVFIGDEQTEVLRSATPHQKLRARMMEMQRMSRDAAVMQHYSVVSVAPHMIDPEVRKTMMVTIILRPESDQVISDALGDYSAAYRSGLRKSDAPHPGCAVWRPSPDAPASVVKCPDYLPDAIDAAAIAMSHLVPALPEEDLLALDREFANEGGRSVYLNRWLRAGAHILESAAVASADPSPRVLPTEPPASATDAQSKLGPAIERMREAEERLRRRTEDLNRASEEPIGADRDLDARFREVVGGGEFDDLPIRSSSDRDRIALVLDIIRGAGTGGVNPQAIADKLNEGKAQDEPRTARQTVSGDVRVLLAAGQVEEVPGRRGFYRINTTPSI